MWYFDVCPFSPVPGYGHIVPVSRGAKVATVLYAIFGIPLFFFTVYKCALMLVKGGKYLRARMQSVCPCGQRQHAGTLEITKKDNPSLHVSTLQENPAKHLQGSTLDPECPATSSDNPTASKNVPTTSSDDPTNAPTTSSDDHKQSTYVPTTSEDVPTTSADVPTTSADVPTTSADVPATSADFPATGAKLSGSKEVGALTNDNLDAPLHPILPTVVLLAYIFIGATGGFLLVRYKNSFWGYWNTVYFIFVSVTTIGFGDFVPRGSAFIPFFLYIMFGLVLVATCILVFIEFFSRPHQMRRRFQYVIC